LLGERDIEKKLLDLPIPTYDSDNLAHEALARLGEQAHQQAQIAVGLTDFPVSGSLARQRGFIRESLATTISEVDDIVRKIL
jgi:hypothetical protein